MGIHAGVHYLEQRDLLHHIPSEQLFSVNTFERKVLYNKERAISSSQNQEIALYMFVVIPEDIN